MEEQEVTNEDVKKEFDEIQAKQAEASEESSAEGKEVSATSTEDVKSVTEETKSTTEETVEDENKTIPYSRFKEVNEKLKNFEALEKEAEQLIERGPDGKLRLKTQAKEEIEEKEEKGLELTEEEQLALDSVQMSVVQKLVSVELQKIERQKQKQETAFRQFKEQCDTYWKKCQEDYPDVKNKDSEFYKKADEIYRTQHIVYGKNFKNNQNDWYAHPNAMYLSCLQAEKELARNKIKTSQAKVEEKKNQKSNVFVEKKSATQQAKKKTDEKDFEKMSASEQEEALREQWDESHPDE